MEIVTRQEEAMATSSRRQIEGFRRVAATQEEIQAWRDAHNGRYPSVGRVRCLGCDKRLWGSGLGIGAHRRACRVETAS